MPLPDAPTDRFDLERFVAAQDLVYPAVLDELRCGRKQTHWIWFIFRTREEAAAYIAHPLLSARLLECTELVLSHVGKTSNQIFGSPDDLKFCSSMTLFAAVSSRSIFQTALDHFYKGVEDATTLATLAKWAA